MARPDRVSLEQRYSYPAARPTPPRGHGAPLHHAHEADHTHRPQFRGHLRHSAHGDPRGLGHRIPEDAGRDRRESQGSQTVLFRHPQSVAVAVGQQRLGRRVHPVHRSQAVDDMPVGKIVAARDHRLPGLDGRERPAFLVETGTGRPVDGARHSSPGTQLGVRRVDHGVEAHLTSDVARHALDGKPGYPSLHDYSSLPAPALSVAGAVTAPARRRWRRMPNRNLNGVTRRTIS